MSGFRDFINYSKDQHQRAEQQAQQSSFEDQRAEAVALAQFDAAMKEAVNILVSAGFPLTGLYEPNLKTMHIEYRGPAVLKRQSRLFTKVWLLGKPAYSDFLALSETGQVFFVQFDAKGKCYPTAGYTVKVGSKVEQGTAGGVWVRDIKLMVGQAVGKALAANCLDQARPLSQ